MVTPVTWQGGENVGLTTDVDVLPTLAWQQSNWVCGRNLILLPSLHASICTWMYPGAWKTPCCVWRLLPYVSSWAYFRGNLGNVRKWVGILYFLCFINKVSRMWNSAAIFKLEGIQIYWITHIASVWIAKLFPVILRSWIMSCLAIAPLDKSKYCLKHSEKASPLVINEWSLCI